MEYAISLLKKDMNSKELLLKKTQKILDSNEFIKIWAFIIRFQRVYERIYHQRSSIFELVET